METQSYKTGERLVSFKTLQENGEMKLYGKVNGGPLRAVVVKEDYHNGKFTGLGLSESSA